MLLVSPSDTARQWFEKDMESQFEITKQVTELSYLGMTIKKTRSGITVHQRGYFDNMVTKFNADPNSKTTSPTTLDFLVYDENDVVNFTDTWIFMSCFYTFMFHVLALDFTSYRREPIYVVLAVL